MKAAIAAALLLLLSLATAFAQVVEDEPYKIQPEDVLRILVYNEQQVNLDVPVGRDGYISAPFVGLIKVAGKTTAEVEAELALEYTKKLRLRDPKVSVSIVRYRVLRASVGGMVNRPGQFDIRQGDTVLGLLNQGGGPVPDRSDLRRATLHRAGSAELIPIDLYSMLVKGDTSQNYLLKDGDELIVPEETSNRILVLGAILQPGAYPYKEPMTVADAISLARGEIRLRSRFSKVLVVRQLPGQPGQYLRIESNFVKFIRAGDASQNVVLLPGDLVWVPETNTPDLVQLSNILQTTFFLDRLFGTNVFH